MALSPFYGWSEPDNSSLVKNGAADIRTLGDAIDTSVWNSGFGQAGKNKIINGAFNVWQRGTSFTNPGNTGAYTADRYTVAVNAATTTHTVSQQSFTAGAAPVTGYESQFFFRSLITTPGSCTVLNIQNRIEDVRTFAGQTVSVSFWAKADTTRAVSVDYYQNFGSGGSGTVSATLLASTNLTTSWVRYTATVILPSISGKTIGTGSYLAIVFNQTVTAGSQLDIWGVQLEYGSKATPFQTASGSIGGELALCQRYYYTVNASDNAYATFGVGQAKSTTSVDFPLTLPVQLRVAPSAVSVTGNIGAANATGGAINVGTISFASTGKSIIGLNMSSTSGLVAGNAVHILANNSTAASISFSAEL